MAKTRLNLSLDPDLVEFVKVFAQENRITVADVFTQYVLALKRGQQGGGDTTETILANPAFSEALADVQTRLKTGKARWHALDEVFS